MRDVYFEVDEKLGFFERMIFDHKLDEDVMMIRRDGVSTAFVHLCCLLAIAILAFISF